MLRYIFFLILPLAPFTKSLTFTIWVVVKIMVRLWAPYILDAVLSRDHNCDNHPCGHMALNSVSKMLSKLPPLFHSFIMKMVVSNYRMSQLHTEIKQQQQQVVPSCHTTKICSVPFTWV